MQCLAHIQGSIIIVKGRQRRRGVDRQKSRGKITWFAEISLVVQWWRLHLLMQGVRVRAKTVAHAIEAKQTNKQKMKKQKHKQQDIVTNSIRTLEMVHIKKKNLKRKWLDFLLRVPRQSLIIIKSSWLELRTVSFPTLQTLTVMRYYLFLPSLAPESGAQGHVWQTEACREWCNIKIWLGKAKAFYFSRCGGQVRSCPASLHS